MMLLVSSIYTSVCADELIDIASDNVRKDYSNFVETMKFDGKDRINNVKLYYNGKLLQSEKDYKVEYSNNFFVGTAEIKFIGIGDFTGEIIKKFYIVKMPVSEITTKASYNSKGELVVSANNGSYPMDIGKDYSYTYSVDFYGNVTVVINGIGDNYTGSVEKTIKNSETPFVATSTYLKNVTGYKLKYTCKKTGENVTLKLKNKIKSYTLTKCKKKATYKIKIRSYIKYDKKTYNGNWSQTYKVKIKK